MKDTPTFLLLLCGMTYFHSFDIYLFKILKKISTLQAGKVHVLHQNATSQDFLPPSNDVVSADYEVSPNCRFSHGTALFNIEQ